MIAVKPWFRAHRLFIVDGTAAVVQLSLLCAWQLVSTQGTAEHGSPVCPVRHSTQQHSDADLWCADADSLVMPTVRQLRYTALTTPQNWMLIKGKTPTSHRARVYKTYRAVQRAQHTRNNKSQQHAIST